MARLPLLVLLALALLCLGLRAQGETLTLDWDSAGNELIERFRLWRTPGPCPQAARPAQPLVTALGTVRSVEDPSPVAGTACYTVTALVPWIAASPTWTPCATEAQLCEVGSGPQVVRYGAQGQYVYQTTSAALYCSHQQFGDPVPGVAKACATTPALGPPQESAPSNAVQHPAISFAAPTGLRLVPQ